MNDAQKSNFGIDIHLAADTAQGSVNPCNDQIWHLSSEAGEPVALSLSTTYGLRAYAMRIFPRFHLKGETVQNPHSYNSTPNLRFTACNFAHIHLSPFPTIDARFRLWVPTSQIVVGQIAITSTASQLEPLAVEWVCMLEPFPGGSTMMVDDQRVNTILAGKTSDLEPVFLLTGMPKATPSLFPSLTSEIALRPGVQRQFTWVISSLENKDLSFYAARRYTASNLEVEELKINVSMKKWFLDLQSNDNFYDMRIKKSQDKAQQLILPAFGSFLHPSLIHSRLEDNGFSRTGKGDDAGESWGIQTSLDVFQASRVLLPSCPELVKGFLQNILEMQSEDGALELLVSWTGKRSGRKATPILSGIALDVLNYTQDLNWLKRVYPVLLESTKGWFTISSDVDEDGFPEWQHPLQTGLLRSEGTPSDYEEQLDILVRTTESPALAAMLWRECSTLVKISRILDLADDVPWLERQMSSLYQHVQSCWNEKAAHFQYRDMLNHTLNTSPRIKTYRRNGNFPFSEPKASASFTILQASLLQDSPHPFEILIQTPDQLLTVNEKAFVWKGKTGYAVVKTPLNRIRAITIRNLRKDEAISFSETVLDRLDASSIIPFWAGIASEDQTISFLNVHLPAFAEGYQSTDQVPTVMKYMLLEILVNSGRNVEALEVMDKWFGIDDGFSSNSYGSKRKLHSLEDLIPMRILLSVFGIELWNRKEIIVKNQNIPLPPITVQYEQTTFKREQGICVITHSNGETTTLDQAGKMKILIV